MAAAPSVDGRFGYVRVPAVQSWCAEYDEPPEPTDAELWGLAPDPESDPVDDAFAGSRFDATVLTGSGFAGGGFAGGGFAGGGFAGGGVLDELEPGAVLAGFAQDAQAAGLGVLSDDELIGAIRAFRRLASWATAGEFATVHELSVRRDREAGARGEDPIRAVAGTEAELSCALTLTQRGAQTLLDRASDLARLPGTAAALAAGVIDEFRARVISEQLSELDVADAQRVEAKLLEKAGSQTSGQLRAAAMRAVFAVDPAATRQRREKAQRDARVEVWREPSGTASIAGRDLPPAEVLAADKRIDALARHLKKNGTDGTLDQLRARVYVTLLTGTPLDQLLGTPDISAASTEHACSKGVEPGAGPEQPAGPGARLCGPAGLAGQINLTLPLSTLLGLSDVPGEVSGFGPVDAATGIELTALAARHSATRWCVTLTGPNGQAIGHGCATRNRLRLAFDIEPLAVGSCTHERQVPGYSPPPSLRHLIEIRDTNCGFPTCRRPAAQCDKDHTTPYQRGGRTCECNIDPVCRLHHQVKQAPGWHLTQPEPGVLHWKSPSGRTYPATPRLRPPPATP